MMLWMALFSSFSGTFQLLAVVINNKATEEVLQEQQAQ